MSTSDGAAWVNYALGFQVFGVGALFILKSSKINFLAMQAYFCDPLLAIRRGANRQKSACIPCARAASVLRVLGATDIPKITERIVKSISVYMINNSVGRFSSDMQPRNPMGSNTASVNGHIDISASSASSNISNLNSVSGLYFPSENTTVGVVVKKFADALCGKINLSHAVSPIKKWFGQKPGSVSALAGLRHFSTLEV